MILLARNKEKLIMPTKKYYCLSVLVGVGIFGCIAALAMAEEV